MVVVLNACLSAAPAPRPRARRFPRLSYRPSVTPQIGQLVGSAARADGQVTAAELNTRMAA
jgi:hypothetical protein